MSLRHLKHVTHLYEKIICKQKQQKQQKQQEEKEEEEEQYQCWFCCSEENLKFINCKKGGIQNIPFGVFITKEDIVTIGTRIGEFAIDLAAGLIPLTSKWLSVASKYVAASRLETSDATSGPLSSKSS